MSQQINLFNPIFLKTQKVFSAISLLQTFGLVLLGAICMVMYVIYQSAGLMRSADIVTAQLRNAEAQIAKLRAQAVVPVANKALEASLAKLEADIQNRQKISAVLQKSDFGNTQGYSAYLVAFARQIPTGLWLTGFTISGGGNEISLQGRTLKPELVPAYVSQLKREPAMQGKSFAALQMQLPEMTGASVQGKSDVAKQFDTAPYIEFNLRSSDLPEKNSSTGVKGQ
ncbi:MAG: PilN domain-containing protein [Undibacterium sp.]|nr:PilN domain-containing protein [Undibacterium sp.]MDO9191623.1 PilN domain-containing protein [Undibacterium sp.]